jgi:4a-hydroxytetrahydrobiopterin dehydratase
MHGLQVRVLSQHNSTQQTGNPNRYNGREAPERRAAMSTTTRELLGKHCQACEGDIQPLTPEQVQDHLRAVPEWKLTADRKRIRREWRVKDFVTALDFFQRVGQVAETEGHHPDLHLTSYRQVAIEIWTHAIGGLSENDFILAARIDTLPVELKK